MPDVTVRPLLRFVLLAAGILGATVAALVAAMGFAFAGQSPGAPKSIGGLVTGAIVDALLAPLAVARPLWPAWRPEGYGYLELTLNGLLWAAGVTLLRTLWRARRASAPTPGAPSDEA